MQGLETEQLSLLRSEFYQFNISTLQYKDINKLCVNTPILHLLSLSF